MKAALAAAFAIVACSKAPEEAPERPSETAVTIPAAAPQPPAIDAAVAMFETPEASAPPPAATPSRPRPKLKEGDVAVGAGLPLEVVRRVLRLQFGRLQMCYESGLRADPTLSGYVTIRFTIKHDGSVTDARAEDTDAGPRLSDSFVERCVLTMFRRASFPETTAGSVRVVYPLSFSQQL